ncbi:MAG: hypothetical protein KTR27_05555 [Leptolyngbyaceae cyanobacterium MAG.088]|nr:hypothetical protein [Leptolyngbyaceae cyanobacterium MAG.088]
MEILAPFLPFLGFPVLWCTVSLLLAYIGGWAKLANQYLDVPEREKRLERIYGMQSGYIGTTRYKGCLNFRIYEEGLGLSVLFLFRIGHPPLFIPWDQFHAMSEKRVFFTRFCKVFIGQPVIATMTFPVALRDHFP